MHDTPRVLTRRRLIASAGLAVPAAVAWPGLAAAAEWTAAERANVAVVTDMCRAWTAPLDYDRIGAFLADDCVFRASETAPAVKGRQAILDSLRKMLGAPTAAEFEVVQTFARGPIVVNERIDRFTLPARRLEWLGVGVFMLRDGRIAEWSDYTIRLNR